MLFNTSLAFIKTNPYFCISVFEIIPLILAVSKSPLREKGISSMCGLIYQEATSFRFL